MSNPTLIPCRQCGKLTPWHHDVGWVQLYAPGPDGKPAKAGIRHKCIEPGDEEYRP